MGSPKKQRKKFSKPAHPWQKERILAEQELLKEYGLNRKYEIWKMNSILKNFTRQAKNLITTKNIQVERERKQLLTKLYSLGLIGKDAKIEDVLSLTLKNIMERRLQTLVFRKNIVISIRQARQFIVHGHISIGDKTIAAPSYLVHSGEESGIQFSQSSIFSNPSHPGRVIVDEVKTRRNAKDKNQSEKKEISREIKAKEKTSEKQKGEKGKAEVPTAHGLKKNKESKTVSEKKQSIKKDKKEKRLR